MTVTTDVVRRVYLDEEGVYLEIGPGLDFPDVLEVRASDKKSIDWFGAVRFSVTDEFAIALGNALIDAAKERS